MPAIAMSIFPPFRASCIAAEEMRVGLPPQSLMNFPIVSLNTRTLLSLIRCGSATSCRFEKNTWLPTGYDQRTLTANGLEQRLVDQGPELPVGGKGGVGESV